jgi:RsiW-degrading membrane proteinase PrsW (M82 family)
LRRLPESQARTYTAKSALVPLSCTPEHGMPNRSLLYLVIGVLVAVVGVLGYNLYQAKREPEGLQINVGPNGLKIQNK